jgi:hypothetical protein
MQVYPAVCCALVEANTNKQSRAHVASFSANRDYHHKILFVERKFSLLYSLIFFTRPKLPTRAVCWQLPSTIKLKLHGHAWIYPDIGHARFPFSTIYR